VHSHSWASAILRTILRRASHLLDVPFFQKKTRAAPTGPHGATGSIVPCVSGGLVEDWTYLATIRWGIASWSRPLEQTHRALYVYHDHVARKPSPWPNQMALGVRQVTSIWVSARDPDQNLQAPSAVPTRCLCGCPRPQRRWRPSRLCSTYPSPSWFCPH
jgi:hypothetical protein